MSRQSAYQREESISTVANWLAGINGGFQRYRADYRMTKETRFNRRRTGLAPYGGSADYHIRNEHKYYEMMEKARDMDRNDAIIGQTIDRAVANQIQDGFPLDVKTGDPALDVELKARWQYETETAEAFDIAGEMDFHDAERYCARAILLDGDCGIAGLSVENRFQFFEGHSIYADSNGSDGIIHGVELDELRRRIAYHIALDDPNPHTTSRMPSQRMETFDAHGVRQFFHVYNPSRSSLTRGVTALAPIFEIAGMLEDINFAKLVQQQIVSCFAVFRMQQLGGPGQPPPSVSGSGIYGSASTEATSGGQRTIEGISPGMEIIGNPGETLEGFSPNVPNAEYFEQVTLIMRLIGVNLGMPLMMVMLDGSDSTFHGYRGALDEARRGFKAVQRAILKRFHSPLYRWKIHQWIMDDPFVRSASKRSDIDIFGHHFSGPGFPYVEPVADANGDVLQLRNGLNSPRRIQQARSRDFNEIIAETIEDNVYSISSAIKAAGELNAKNKGVQVQWRDLISMPVAEGVTVSQSMVEPMPETEPKPEPVNV